MVIHEIWIKCDCCGDLFLAETLDCLTLLTQQQARKIARSSNWRSFRTYRNKTVDHCPECAIKISVPKEVFRGS